jgi:predicted acyltransferase
MAEMTEIPRPATGQGVRIDSVDTLRGLTILLMVFVNDLGPGAPSWMHHIRPPDADGMTLADIVFPFFLFIVGVSIPLAQERAEGAGLSRRSRLGHILLRTAALLLMGAIEINSRADRTLGEPLWGLLAAVSVILAWNAIPREPGWRRSLFTALKILGAISLLVLLVSFRRQPGPAEIPFRGTVSDWTWMRTEWGGILGLIGWAYLTASIAMMYLGRRREWLMGAMAILMLVHLAVHSGGLLSRLDSKPWLGPALPALRTLSAWIAAIGGSIGLGDAVGSLAGVTMAGCLLGTILRRDSDITTHRGRLSWAATFVTGLFLAGLVTDSFEGINKIAATLTWCLWSAALAGTAWMLLYNVMDVGEFRAWSIIVRPAGANPLVAYFLHPIVIYLVFLMGFSSTILGYKSSHDPWTVILGSLGMALFVCAATGMLARLGVRMRL